MKITFNTTAPYSTPLKPVNFGNATAQAVSNRNLVDSFRSEHNQPKQTRESLFKATLGEIIDAAKATIGWDSRDSELPNSYAANQINAAMYR